MTNYKIWVPYMIYSPNIKFTAKNKAACTQVVFHYFQNKCSSNSGSKGILNIPG